MKGNATWVMSYLDRNPLKQRVGVCLPSTCPEDMIPYFVEKRKCERIQKKKSAISFIRRIDKLVNKEISKTTLDFSAPLIHIAANHSWLNRCFFFHGNNSFIMIWIYYIYLYVCVYVCVSLWLHGDITVGGQYGFKASVLGCRDLSNEKRMSVGTQISLWVYLIAFIHHLEYHHQLFILLVFVRINRTKTNIVKLILSSLIDIYIYIYVYISFADLLLQHWSSSL